MLYLQHSRLKAVWPWLAEAKYTWLTIVVTSIALFVSLRSPSCEPLIRWTGLILQLLGIGTVIWGIYETRKLFGHPPIVSKTKAWLRRFPLLRRNIVIGVSGLSMSISMGKARGYVGHGPGANPNTEARLDALEKNIEAIHARISAMQKEMDQELQKAADALKQEQQFRQIEDTAMRNRLEAASTGGMHISAIGASWLLIGVILSTAAPEIAAVLKLYPSDSISSVICHSFVR